MFMYYYIVIFEGRHDQFHLLSLIRSLVGHNFPLFFSKEKETPLKLEERLGYMQAAFLNLDFGHWTRWTLGVPDELVDESFKWSSLF